MIRRLTLLVMAILWSVGCNPGTPYAFRLVVPRTLSSIEAWMPYVFWQELERFPAWQACEAARVRLQEQALAGLGRTDMQEPVRELWLRELRAECAPLR